MRHKTKDFVMRKKKEKIEMTDKEEELMRIFWNQCSSRWNIFIL